MKRLLTFLFTVCLTIAAFSAPAFITAQAAGDDTVILFQGAEQENGEVKIDVNVRENAGVYAMVLTLDYDASALTLTGLEYGTAFQSLDPLSSGDYSTIPYKISYMGDSKQNDTSTGKMMTLTFTVKDNAPDGEYTVTFGYEKNKDVTYLKNGEIQTKNLIIDGARITLKNSGIENVETEQNSDPPEDTDGGMVGVIVAGSVVGVAATALTVVLIVRKKRHKWTKV